LRRWGSTRESRGCNTGRWGGLANRIDEMGKEVVVGSIIIIRLEVEVGNIRIEEATMMDIVIMIGVFSVVLCSTWRARRTFDVQVERRWMLISVRHFRFYVGID
jgi:hypothetical protein